jgi:hypothetical protein
LPFGHFTHLTVVLGNCDLLINWQLTIFRKFSPAVVFTALFTCLLAAFRSRPSLQQEMLALHHQLGVQQRSTKRAKLATTDRFRWTRLSQFWSGWRSVPLIVKPETVIGWYRKGLPSRIVGRLRHLDFRSNRCHIA